ncbi:MAG: hypothetical protein EX263_00960 [Flavobacteriaceae bacterium]|nr:hypothetical protein [Flavobacteriaceae bacterium]NNL32154.1 hypothetical protein [Flavobacteriaceae bacterium]RZW57368.1 MAG: hypothetical protein EX263_00960 [Flavobacteriaceae bacterium]
MFKHLLITRFNLRNSNWTTDKKNVEVLTEQWHENRFKIFRDFCFSSVAAQTNTNFEWLVYFDVTTPDKFKRLIAELDLELDCFKPIFVDGMNLFVPSIKSHIASLNEPYLITSRIDNDDCLSKHYIEEVQKRFDAQDFMAIDFVDGYTLQIQPEFKLGKRLDQFNPFISLIEKNDDPKSVWSIRHSHWKRESKITQVRDIRVWASVIHAENKINGFGGYGHVDADAFFKDFKCDPSIEADIKAKAIPVTEWRGLSLKNIRRSYWNFYFKSFKKKIGVYKIK